MSVEKSVLDINSSIMKHIAMLRPVFPKSAVIFLGDYSSQLFKENFLGNNDDILTFLVQKTKGKASKVTQKLDRYNVWAIDEKVNTHYWYSVQQYLSNNVAFFEQMKNKPIDKLEGAIFVASVGEGLGSVLLSELSSRFKEQDINSVDFAITPSELQPSDATFNALWALATISKNGFPLVLIDRDSLESYVGVDRKGSVLKGNMFLKYLLEMILTKETFVQEINELSKSFNVKMFTILSATGASIKVYGTIKNILDTALIRPFVKFDISSATVLYVLVRMPLPLKEKFPRGIIELTIDGWLREKTNLKSAYFAEPVYVDDGSDRIDILLFLGGFDLSQMVTPAEKKTKDIKNYAIKNGFIKEKEWADLINSLVE